MADGIHVAAHALIVEVDYQPVCVAAHALIVELDHQPIVVAAVALVVELDAHPYIGVAAVALIVELDVVPAPFDTAATNACVRGILDGVEAVEERMRVLVEGGTESTRDWQQLVSALAGYQVDIRECRAVLDAADAADALPFQNAEASVRLWQWSHGVRIALVDIELRLLEAVNDATEIVGSLPSRNYAVKSGDTLQTIAARQLGDWQLWPELAKLNGIDPGPLTPGVVLVLPEVD